MSVKGQCKLCNGEYTKGGFTRHLNKCINEMGLIGQTKDYECRNMYLMLITDVDDPRYFLYVLIDSRATLKLLDDFLRGFWLECCGHLSEFEIADNRFSCDINEDAMQFFSGTVYGMDHRLCDIASQGMSIGYTYDFGSSTDLKIEVKKVYEHIAFKETVRIVAQNSTISGDPYNSPRTFVCGYEGNHGFDVSKLSMDDYEVMEMEEDLFDIEPNEEVFQNISNAFLNLIEDTKKRDKKCSKKYYLSTPNTNLKNCLSVFSRDELYKISQKLDLSGISSAKKNELLVILASVIPDRFEKGLSALSYENYSAIEKSINDNGIEISADNERFDNASTLFEFIETSMLFPKMVGDKRFFILPDELKRAFEWNNTFALKEVTKHNSYLMNLVKGMVYYYGIIDIYDAYNQLEKLKVDSGINVKSFAPVLMKNVVLDEKLNYREGKIVYSEVEDHKSLLRAIKDRENVLGQQPYKEFTPKELIAASKKDFFKRTKEIIAFENYLKSDYGLRGEELQEFIFDFLYIMDQTEGMDTLYELIQAKFEIPSLETLNELIMLASHVYNNHRQWVLKGYAPNELSENDTVESSYIEPMQDIDQPVKKKVKIGRNQPCPCGSGKKYKKCCGK